MWLFGCPWTLQLPNGFIKREAPAHFHSTPSTFLRAVSLLSVPSTRALSSSALRLPRAPSSSLTPCLAPPSAEGTSALTFSVRRVHFLLLCLAEPSFAGATAAISAHCRCCRCLCPCPEPTLPRRAQCFPLPVSLCPQPCIYPSPDLPQQHDWTTAMVCTRGGHRYRPRVRFSTPERDDAGTSRAVDAHSPGLPTETQPALASAAVPEEAQASEPPSR